MISWVTKLFGDAPKLEISVPTQRMRQLTADEITTTCAAQISNSAYPTHGNLPDEQWWVCEFYEHGSWRIVAAYPVTLNKV